MNNLHPSTANLIEGLLDHVGCLIDAAVEAGDIENAAALMAEWGEWLDTPEGTHLEITTLPPLS